VSVSELELSMPPPSWPPELPETVLLVSMSVPLFEMPPPP